MVWTASEQNSHGKIFEISYDSHFGGLSSHSKVVHNHVFSHKTSISTMSPSKNSGNFVLLHQTAADSPSYRFSDQRFWPDYVVWSPVTLGQKEGSNKGSNHWRVNEP